MKQRHPRSVVAPIVAELTDWAAADGLAVEFGGSWRRGCDTVGDLDLVIFADTLDGIMLPDGFTVGRSGQLVAQTSFRGVQVDIWACPPECAGPFMWFITGPRELNVAMRAHAKRLGYKLSQMHLDGFDGPVATEADVAAALGLAYVSPEQREAWRSAPAADAVPVTGSKGDTYYLTRTGDSVRCTCTGFRYRHTCRHAMAYMAEVAA